MHEVVNWDDTYRTGEYKNHWGIPHPSPELVAFLASHSFGEGNSALDVGCGAGQESIFLAQQGLTVTGVDQSAEALKIAERKAKEAEVQVNWQQGNVLQLPLPDQSIDLINDRGCFHVIPDESREAYAKEMARVLRPGGKIFLRGCRDNQGLPQFTSVTREAIQKYFDQDFYCQSLLPLEIITGNGQDRLKANLVILVRK